MTKCFEDSKRPKHIDIRVHFIKILISKREIDAHSISKSWYKD